MAKIYIYKKIDWYKYNKNETKKGSTKVQSLTNFFRLE